MSQIVICPGGFHPFHAGHYSLYNSAKEQFPDADVYVAATDDTSKRPFPFAIKEKLARVAGVDKGYFVKVKSPFRANEITDNYDPEKDTLIFVRSEKDRNEQPKPGGIKKDGSPSYFQPYTGKNIQPFNKHAYIAYLPTVKFGPDITSATEIRNSWPNLNDRQKLSMVMSLYPATQKNTKLANNVKQLLDAGMGSEEVTESAALSHSAVRKRKKDPNPDRKGPAINVNTKKKSNEDLQKGMKPTHVSGEEKPGAVKTLEKALLKAKDRGIKLDYDKIDKIMQLICKEHQLTGDKLHSDFAKKHHMVPDKWIVKQTVVTESIDYLDEK